MSELEHTEGDAQLRLPRRRRTSPRAPKAPPRAQLAEDAPGRVELIFMRTPADVLEPADSGKHQEDAAAEPQAGDLVGLLLTRDGWIAVAGLILVLVVLFLIGLRFTS